MPPTINNNSTTRAVCACTVNSTETTSTERIFWLKTNYGRSNAQGESIDVGAHSTVIFCRLSMTILPCYVGRILALKYFHQILKALLDFAQGIPLKSDIGKSGKFGIFQINIVSGKTYLPLG
ncbi:hypothetical protein T07_8930 [Trichinella nelsoni]|uniref:Uncharacterized protein n=1 Tax=Trichinella nelsoni TaxID=6336 RepID=A0A0V0SJY0_9BILA|nr:hypothetical protein T07_8930 [Trichinella nelsoni]